MYSQISLAAAAALIQDSQTLALGGMTLYRRPVAFVRALLRREPRPKDLTLLCFTAGLESDLLVGAGCVGTVRTVYFGLEAFGLAPMFTQAAQSGAVRILEETEASIAMGMRATMAGVGFMPSHAWMGTDLPRLRPDVKTVRDPYSGEELMAFPAISVDVAVLHGLEADRRGNVRLSNNLGVDMELVYIARKVIVTVERLVERIEPTADSQMLPAPGADYIVHAPQGAWPTACYPDYLLAGGEFLRYSDLCGAGQFDQYLADFLADGRSDMGE
jgi:glutaconate CoA-transferase subunit A